MKYNGTDLSMAEKLQQILDKELGDGTAISFACVKEGEVIVAAAAGTKDGNPDNPVDIGDLYNIGSVSKVYCAMAVFKLAQMGKVDIDVPIVNYLPQFSMQDARYRKITLRMCLNHSSGLPGSCFKHAFCTRFIGDNFYKTFFEYLSRSSLKSEPGTISVYCNDGFTLAEATIAHVSGMTYTAFVQKYVAMPLGCTSTCSGENNPDNRQRVQAKTWCKEFMSILGTGGISTDISDCARFGWSFIEPADATIGEYTRMSASPQGASPIDDSARIFGFGWDSVNFGGYGYDFGERTLLKSGGTVAFLSYLIVIPRHRIAAAISMTSDVRIDLLSLLCSLCGVILNLNRKEIDYAEEVRTSELSLEFVEKNQGLYISFSNHYQVSFPEGKLRIMRDSVEGCVDMVSDATFDGTRFHSTEGRFSFHKHGNATYLMMESSDGYMALGEKLSFHLNPNNAWKKRDKKVYILEDGDEWDIMAGAMWAGFRLETACDGGLASIILQAPFVPYAKLPVFPIDDDHTEMLLTAPYIASRDVYPMYAWEENGAEHLYTHGFTFIDGDSLPILPEGALKLTGIRKSVAFKVDRKITIQDRCSEIRIVAMDETGKVVWDTLTMGELASLDKGYVIFLTEVSATLEIRE